MELNNKTILVVVVLALALGAAAWFSSSSDRQQEQTEKTAQQAMIDEELYEDSAIDNFDTSQPSTEEPKPQVSVPLPDLDKPVIFREGVSVLDKKDITKRIEELSALLKEDANRFNQWMDLGALRKSIGDYEAAREIWEYAAAIRPNTSLVLANLGMLYGYYLSEPEKAEQKLLQAIENNPQNLNFYRQLFDFYLEVQNDREGAREILERGLVDNPGNETLEAWLRQLSDINKE